MKKKPKYNMNSVVRGALRRAFARSPLVQEKMAESRREIPRYNKDGSRAKRDWVQRQCETCKEWVGSTKLSVDHVDPVVSVDDGFQDWNEFIKRLWCSKENLQRLCSACHDSKTAIERITRLTKQYTIELDEIEIEISSCDTASAVALIKKRLAKYIAKKKTQGLKSVVERAIDLRNCLNKLK